MKTASYPIEAILLQTKLYRPSEMREVIERPRLWALLNAGLGRPLTLVTAPSGYGKTTLVGSWLAAENLPAAWLSLDEEDNDLVTFINYFVAALRTVLPGAGHSALALVNSPQNPPPAVLADTLIDDLSRSQGPLIIVLDDYHVIEDESIHRVIDRLVKYIPQGTGLLIISRTTPPLLLGRLRAQSRLHEIYTDDTAFDLEEARQLLNRVAGRTLEPQVVALLERRTEGWAAGLQLAGLSARATSSANLADQLESLGNGPVVDYLIEEVADLIPAAVRDFLLRTSILSRFNADLCAAVVSGESDGTLQTVDTTLGRIVAANLFIFPLDDRGEWFRYHHLFRDVLQRYLRDTLSPADIADLHRRAGRWYEDNGIIAEAIRHAVAAGDELSAARMVETRFHEVLNQEDWRRLARWLDLLPASMQERPAVLIARGSVERLRFRMAIVQDYATRAEHTLSQTADSDLTVDRETLLGELYALFASTAYWREDGDAHAFYTKEALARIRPDRLYAASIVEMQVAYVLDADGRSDEALAYLQDRIEAHRTDGDALAMRLLLGMCSIYASHADLVALQRVGETYLRLAEDNSQAISRGWANLSLGMVAYEWNDVSKAEHHFSQITALPYALSAKCAIDGFIGLCLTLAAARRYDDMERAFADLKQFVAGGGYVAFGPIVDSFERRLTLSRLLAAGDRVPITAAPPPFIGPLNLALQEYPPLTDARWLIALGTEDGLRSAIEKLTGAIYRADQLHSVRRLIEMKALMALAQSGLGRDDEALDALAEALYLAEPGRFVQTFLDCGPVLMPLLQQLVVEDRCAAYATQLLAAFAQSAADIIDTGRSLDALLTNRELDVLERLAKRMSNKEIAAELYVSPQTVKTHAQNLYNKLGVSSRREAVAVAQRLQLIR